MEVGELVLHPLPRLARVVVAIGEPVHALDRRAAIDRVRARRLPGIRRDALDIGPDFAVLVGRRMDGEPAVALLGDHLADPGAHHQRARDLLVPGVVVGADAVDRDVDAAADQDRRLVGGARDPQRHLAEAEELAVIGELVLGPQPVHHVQAFGEQGGAAGEELPRLQRLLVGSAHRDQGVELALEDRRLPRAGAGAEDRAALRDLPQRRPLLGDVNRVADLRNEDAGAELDAAGLGGRGGQRPDRAIGRRGAAPAERIVHPDGVEPHRLGLAGGVQQLQEVIGFPGDPHGVVDRRADDDLVAECHECAPFPDFDRSDATIDGRAWQSRRGSGAFHSAPEAR